MVPEAKPPVAPEVFFSYARKDAAAAQPIIEALVDAGVKLFVDEKSIDHFESITKRIQEGLVHSKILVAFYSRTYPERVACQWELTAAYVAAQAEGDPRRRVVVLNPEASADHIHPAELRDARFAMIGPGGESPGSVAEIIREHLKTVRGSFIGLCPFKVPGWFPIHPVHWMRFVGRIHDLWHVHQSLSKGNNPIFITGMGGPGSSGPSTAFITGLGGIGKTLLAEEYALRFQYAYPGGIFWLKASLSGSSASTTEIQDRLFQDVALDLGLEVSGLSALQVRAQLRGHFDRLAQPVLWVIDDLPPRLRDEEVRRWQGPSRYCNTLFTTRSKEYAGDQVALDVLEKQEAVRLLRIHRPPSSTELTHAEGLAQDLGYHALACEVAGQLLATGAYSYQEYRSLLANPNQDALRLSQDLRGILPHDHERSISATLLRSIDALSSAGRLFLCIGSSLGSYPIPADLASQIFSIITSLDDAEGSQDLQFAPGASDVEAHSLCQRLQLGDASYRVHDLVSHTMRHYRMQVGELAAMRLAGVIALNRCLPAVTDIRFHSRLSEAVAHGRVLFDQVSPSPHSANLGNWLGRYDFERGEYRLAARMNEQVLEIRRRVLGKEHPDTLMAMGNLASALRAQGDYAGARKLEEKGLDVMLRVLGAEHPNTLAGMGNLASTLFAQGDHAGARKISEQVLEARRRVLGEEHPATLTAMGNLAANLFAQGDHAGARKLTELQLEVMRRMLGEAHPGTLTAMSNLVSILRTQGDYPGARKLAEHVLEAKCRVLGVKHPRTFAAMGNLAATLHAQGDHESARSLEEQVLSAMRHMLGEEHPDTLAAMGNLASTLRAQGDYIGSRILAEQELDILRRVMGAEHPDTLTSMANLASTLIALGDYASARRVSEQVLEMRHRVLGAEHPNTLIAMGALAKTLFSQGDHSGARNLAERVLEIMRRVLGEEHPDTLTTMDGMASVLQAQGDHDGARELAEQVLEVRRRVLGAEHPDTLHMMGNLASVRFAQGDYEGAQELQEEVLEVMCGVVGEVHPDTLIVMGDLASTLQAQGDHAGARKLAEQVLEAMLRLHGEEHPQTLAAMGNLASALRAQGDYEGARNFGTHGLAIMLRVLGAEHPVTLATKSNLASTLFAQGDHAGAQNLTEQVLEAMLRVHGAEHPDTLATMGNLASNLQAQGDHAGARKLEEQVLEIMRRVLGGEHPDTLTMMSNLASTLRANGDHAGAIKLDNEAVIIALKGPVPGGEVTP